jgi:hypothetical protein
MSAFFTPKATTRHNLLNWNIIRADFVTVKGISFQSTFVLSTALNAT